MLMFLASHAKADGTDAHPSIGTLSEESGYGTTAVRAALGRLEAAGLVAKDGESAWGTTRWKLPVFEDHGDAVKSPREEARQRQRAKNAERQKRFRDARRAKAVTPSDTVTRNAVGERYAGDSEEGKTPEFGPVTPSDSVTSRTGEALRNAPGQRYVTLSAGVKQALNPNNPLETALEENRSTGRYGLVSDGSADADGVFPPHTEEDADDEQGRDWADELADAEADADNSPAVVAESKDGRDGELTADAATDALSPVPAAPEAQSQPLTLGDAVTEVLARVRGDNGLSWVTPNAWEKYLRTAPDDPQAVRMLHRAKAYDLVGRVVA
ncbi:hypothetical protein FKO37_39930 [Amycolatopsis sp. Poz14]|nr:hypothetical protein [Amycolatopsis sp. Poz14]